MTTENGTALQILMNDDLYLTQADLQQESFVAALVEPAIIISEEKVTQKIEFIGKNLQNFLILTEGLIQDNHLKALESTLLRKQLSLDDVVIVNFSAQDNLDFEELNASFMPQKLVLFGLNPETINLPKTELNQLTSFDNCRILYTYSFDEMLGNKEKTKAFWEPMKNI